MKKRSVIERCFAAAHAFCRNRGLDNDFLDVEDMDIHVGYRCGWAAGYERAKREQRNAHKRGEK